MYAYDVWNRSLACNQSHSLSPTCADHPERLKQRLYSSPSSKAPTIRILFPDDAACSEWCSRLLSDPILSGDELRFRSWYKLGRELGKGEQATVYEGVHLGTQERFAIKVINKKLVLPEHVAQAKLEFRLGQQFHHTHIIRMHDLYDCQDTLYEGTISWVDSC